MDIPNMINNLCGHEKISLCDWPGEVSTVLFFGGCNLRCPTCHNKEIAWQSQKVEKLDFKETIKKIKEKKEWLDGITFTGGEVTIFSDLQNVLDITKKETGLSIKVDSNGMNPQIIKEILKNNLVDQFAIDVKGPFFKYPELTGRVITIEQAEEDLNYIFGLAKENPDKFYFRCTKVPSLTKNDLETVDNLVPENFSVNFQEYIPV